MNIHRIRIFRLTVAFLLAPAAIGTTLATSASDTTASASAGRPALATKRPVFAHYVPWFPVSLDNQPSSWDYYAREYLPRSGEGGIHAWSGGYLRDRPLPRNPLSGDWQLADLRSEVRQAKTAGLSGFAVDMSNRPGPSWVPIGKILQAASAEGSFKIMLQPDMSAMKSVSVARFAAWIAPLTKHGATYRMNDNRVIISPYHAENKSPAWYSQTLRRLKLEHGVSAALLPVLLDASKLKKYASISIGLGVWGVRSPAEVSSYPKWAARAHEMKKLWMEPVAVQDVRPAQIGSTGKPMPRYHEANNTATLAGTWGRAISQKADLVMLNTWNDYAESTAFAPSANHGWAFLDLNRYYLDKYRFGSKTVRKEQVLITHRIQKTSTPVAYPATMKLVSSSSRARNKVEVVTLLAKASTVTVRIASSTQVYRAPAGRYAKLFPLAAGRFTATVTRLGQRFSVTTKKAASFGKTAKQDLTYYGVVSD